MLLLQEQYGTIHKLQRVQNNAAMIVHQAPRRSHAYPLLKKLHWLPVEQRTYYKLALLTFKIRRTDRRTDGRTDDSHANSSTFT